jgi:hypothetical protein
VGVFLICRVHIDFSFVLFAFSSTSNLATYAALLHQIIHRLPAFAAYVDFVGDAVRMAAQWILEPDSLIDAAVTAVAYTINVFHSNPALRKVDFTTFNREGIAVLDLYCTSPSGSQVKISSLSNP